MSEHIANPEQIASEVQASPPVVLTIAGSDSGGGAGIAADLKTFMAHRVFGTVAITAVTAQNTEKVEAIELTGPTMLAAQIDAVLSDFPVAALKTGMLGSTDLIDVVRRRVDDAHLANLVVDPVMVAASGANLVEDDVQRAYRALIRFARVVTPNLFEAEVLTGRDVRDVAAMKDAARALIDLGADIALIKGGHLDGDVALDIVFDGETFVELSASKIATANVHGTGCTLSAAIAANLAHGHDPTEAIALAKQYVTDALNASVSWHIGHGPGPLDHLVMVDKGRVS